MKGIYALEIQLLQDAYLMVGAIGEVCLTKGKYIYIGSAQNNLENRVKRHLRRNKKIFWHIDYLLNHECAKVTKVMFIKAGKENECKIARKLSKEGNPIAKFGCSDCNCKSHLFQINNSKTVERQMQILNLK